MDNNMKLVPLITYINVDRNKFRIYKENRGKSGIYRLNNLITGKSYVGSSISLNVRFRTYCSLAYLTKIVKRDSSAISNALLKYGYKNFSLDILEYCKSSILIEREQYYINLLKPKYNILKVAGSRLGFKHSEITKTKISGVNNHFFGKNHTYESRKMIGESLRSIVRVNSKPKVMKPETKLKLSLRSHGVSVIVFDESNKIINKFPIMTSASQESANLLLKSNGCNSLDDKLSDLKHSIEHYNALGDKANKDSQR